MVKKYKRENRPYTQGFRIGVSGRSDNMCPYSYGNPNCRGMWYAGWREGRGKFLEEGMRA